MLSLHPANPEWNWETRRDEVLAKQSSQRAIEWANPTGSLTLREIYDIEPTLEKTLHLYGYEQNSQGEWYPTARAEMDPPIISEELMANGVDARSINAAISADDDTPLSEAIAAEVRTWAEEHEEVVLNFIDDLTPDERRDLLLEYRDFLEEEKRHQQDVLALEIGRRAAPYVLPSRSEQWLMEEDRYRAFCSLPIRARWTLTEDGKRQIIRIWSPDPKRNDFAAFAAMSIAEAKLAGKCDCATGPYYGPFAPSWCLNHVNIGWVPTKDELEAMAPTYRDAAGKLHTAREELAERQAFYAPFGRGAWLQSFLTPEELAAQPQRKRIDQMLRDLDADAQRNGFVAEDAEVRWHSQRQTNIHEVADEYAGPIDIGTELAHSETHAISEDDKHFFWDVKQEKQADGTIKTIRTQVFTFGSVQPMLPIQDSQWWDDFDQSPENVALGDNLEAWN